MKNVFLLDDDINHLEVLAFALIETGYGVIPEIEAESARAVLTENDGIDLIIFNYEMQGLDGAAFLAMLRELMPHVPVIVLTRHSNMDAYLKVMSLGAFEYMIKPVGVSELRRVVKAALPESEQRRSPRRRR